MGDVHFREQLKAASLRVTVQRIAVLRVLKNNPHIDIASFAYIVRAELGTISLQAVYDILAALADAKLVRYYSAPDATSIPHTKQILGREGYWRAFREFVFGRPSQHLHQPSGRPLRRDHPIC
ncbi:transcriptional repressor [Streptomyces lanatus]|uniref:Transcriptional repressor n=1 Tax=Streptomyces lanatus TaxID=66900 RepID=A0ABV1Y7V1_9ACTN|nr:transcriptional repressor [Streptomyces lanatus]GHG98541.1 hypothetical protein GCM10018780_24360 [Streptomyces lanatus]